MSESLLLQRALRLPAPDVEALIQGRMIAAIPRQYIHPVQREFVLYPADDSINALPADRFYRSNFLPIAQSALTQLGSETVLIKAWARCEHWENLDNTGSLDALSRLTVWTDEALQETLAQRQHIFLSFLRVYQLPHPIEVRVCPEDQNKTGKFVSLPHTLSVTESVPVLSDRIFHPTPPPARKTRATIAS
jgi:hypothetical protein